MKSGVLAIAAFAIGLATAGAARAGDAAAGARLAHKCESCHGLDGLSKVPEAPNIAGQVETYIIEQLTAFRSGERHNEMMSLVAPTLSDDDIANLAAYFSAIEISVGKLPGQ